MTKWITTKEIVEVAECGYNKAQEIRREVNEMIEAQGFKVVNKKKAPRKEVLKYLGLEDNNEQT